MSIFRKPRITDFEAGCAFVSPYLDLERHVRMNYCAQKDAECFNEWFEGIRVEPRGANAAVCGTYVAQNKCDHREGGQWKPGRPHRFPFSIDTKLECPCPVAREKDALGADAR